MPHSAYGAWALIIGGSEGVGAELARKLAADGANLVLVARKPDPLETLAAQIRAESGVEVRLLARDMTDPRAIADIISLTDGLEVGFVAFNAGAGITPGPFVDQTIDEPRKTMQLNVVMPTELAHHFGGKMAQRRRGGLMFLGSGAGEAGTAGVATYSAVKAYLRTLAEALWFELKPSNVDVLIMVLGVTRTPQLGRLGYPIDDPTAPGSDPRDVALEGLARMKDGPVFYAAESAEEFDTVRRLTRGEAAYQMGQRSLEILSTKGRDG